ncbi:PorP/SprF family type IX secretion system membrane protein [Galbibacter pacificus]|uniref:Type IX secretion system membrane protein PorP/SprF n=1 Tax=Galbibacter pacificus TaxID=2996052 RepID=A0ABT6FWA1_9FLAO|nr:type IX secretion system membrane protein PorP/SprF [Galbibacter pacificus]MDG3584010.1 type IX secretion system membrane protein PorP/SprF [Galbibacter pacificus]MDG3587553.1 type IX secretion system membrane protein PorP/SprF [Galbibacter pacificus]
MKISNSYIKNVVLIAITLLTCYLATAQQQPQFTQYMYNTLTLNSGYVSDYRIEAGLIHRSQWVGIDGAPTTQSLTVAGRSGERIGLGLTVINDNIGPSNDLDINGVFSYSIPITYNMHLSFGINAGIDILNVDWSEGEYADQPDPILNNNVNNVTPIIGAGTYLYSSNWYVGVSAPNFIKTKSYNDDDELVIDKTTEFYLIGGYVFDITPAFKLKPSTLLKYTEGAPVTVDLSLNALIQEKFTVGTSYRFNDALSVLLGFQISRSFFAGYAFDYSTTELTKYNDGSHEIMLRYTLPNLNKRAKSPRFF